jgi:hypothetical protein
LFVINEIGLFIEPAGHRGPRGACDAELGMPWHYRCAAEWWPDVLAADGEARLLRRLAERAGGPTLEVGFGLGVRLLACRIAGLDIDGVETSRGLYEACRERFAVLGHARHRLYLQPWHELELPRRYRSIYAGRVLGTGAGRESDALGLYRLYRALEPGGSLVIDHPTPRPDPWRWTSWWGGARRSWSPALEPWELVSPSGRAILRLSSQLFEHEPETASLSFTVSAALYEQSELRRTRCVALRQRFYTAREVTALLRGAGFDERNIAAAAVPGAQRHIWIAHKGLPDAGQPNPSGAMGLLGLLAMRSSGGSW